MKNFLTLATIGILLAIVFAILFPHLLPTDDTIPDREILEGQSSFARMDWLDALSFEVILDATLERFGVPQFHNMYLGGGHLISGDPRDGTLNPITWPLIGFSPLARMKAKILLALVFGFFAVYGFARRITGLSVAGSILSGLFFLLGMRFWPSLIESPLDAGILFALPAITIAWTSQGKARDAIIAGGFIALALMQTGPGMGAVILGFFLATWPLALEPKKEAPDHPVFYSLLAVGFAILFATYKLVPMAEAAPSLSAFWSYCTVPFVRVSPFAHLTIEPTAFWVKTILAGTFLTFWMVRDQNKKAGVLTVLSFFLICMLPDWGFLSGGWFEESRLPGVMDSPARFFFPFFVFFGALSCAAGGARIRHSYSSPKMLLVFAFILTAAFIATSTAYFRTIHWTPLTDPINFSEYKDTLNAPDFFQIRVPKQNDEYLLPENLHPALLAKQHIGIKNSPTIGKRFRKTVPRLRIRKEPPTVERIRRYRGEWNSSARRMEYLHIQDWGNKIELALSANRTGYYLINRNFDRGWKSKEGLLMPYRGQMAIKIDNPGEYQLTLKYRPFSLVFGALISALSIVFAFVFLIPQKAR
jgi:hypothetical protein